MSTPSRPPLCLRCSLYDAASEDPPRCQAFPRGIPDPIFDGVVSHLTTINGEPTFRGTIPVGYELLRPPFEDAPEAKTEAESWTPARHIERP